MIMISNKKHKSNKKGVTILYALLGILLFTMVSTVIFNAATANYTRFVNEQDSKQSYLAVSSAANTFVEAVAGDKVTFKKTVTTDSSGSVVSQTTPIEWKYVDNGFEVPSTGFESVLMTYVKTIYADNFKTPIKNDFLINAKIDDKELENVYVSFTMDKYNIKAVFSNYNETIGQEVKDVYYLTVNIPFVREEGNYNPVVEKDLEVSVDGSNTVTTSIYKVEWDAGNVSITRGKN